MNRLEIMPITKINYDITWEQIEGQIQSCYNILARYSNLN